MDKYIISIDQSTQGTKALLFNQDSKLLWREDLLHKQIVNELGWVSHDLNEIYRNTIDVVISLIKKSGINPEKIICVGISNQRETSCMWDKKTSVPVDSAIVWQCSRAKDICEREYIQENEEMIQRHTGLKLSPYFPAAKFAWLLENNERAKKLAINKELCYGTIDSWLLFKLTKGKAYKTDYSNASRTQLFNIHTLQWDKQICDLFGISVDVLPEVCDSNSLFGETDFDGFLKTVIPIRCVLGDSHAALFGQGCINKGMVKATYGTGTSVMMNIGEEAMTSTQGVVTSIAWGIDGKINYVMEGNVNYTGAIISWLKNDVRLIESPIETEELARTAIQDDELYFIPAFTGLGAPYWDSNARASFIGISRSTGKEELVRASLESIAYQITDIIKAMEDDTKMPISTLCVDGGMTKNKYLMQFQSNIANTIVEVPEIEELSAVGVAYMAGITEQVYDFDKIKKMNRTLYKTSIDNLIRNKKYEGWKEAIKAVLSK